jgi:hypothetical protein
VLPHLRPQIGRRRRRPMQTTPDTEHRNTPRRTTLKSGKIVFNGGRSTLDCTVRNLSPKGAKLLVASAMGIPDSFDLIVAGATRQPCRIIWRRLKEVGVEFGTAH